MGTDGVGTGAAVGVLLVDVGGPATLADVEPFIATLLSQRGVLPLPGPLRRIAAWAIARGRRDRVVRRYAAIGGGSPIDREVAAQVAAVGAALGAPFVVDRGYSCSRPSIADGLRALVLRGAVRVVGVPLFPHESGATWRACAAALRDGARALGVAAVVTPSFPTGAGYLRCLHDVAAPLAAGADHVLLVAHGLPVSHVRRGDPYVVEVRRTASALAERLGRDATTCSLAFQSRLGPVEWTGPYLSDELRRVAGAGARSVAVVPLSFACENLETLWDLDREARDLAVAAGLTDYRRAPAPGAHPAFVEQLCDLVRQAAVREAWVGSAPEPVGEGAP
jgi:ferrochelatase